MAAFAVDTDCLIAALCSWHESHAVVREEIAGRMHRGEQFILSAHTLVEAYAVLTRLPAPHRLSPQDAYNLIEANAAQAIVPALTANETLATLRRLRDIGKGGGLSYDALILAAAQKGGARVLLTFNEDDFEKLEPSNIEIRMPCSRALK